MEFRSFFLSISNGNYTLILYLDDTILFNGETTQHFYFFSFSEKINLKFRIDF